MKLLRKDSLSGTGCSLTSEDVRSSDKDNLIYHLLGTITFQMFHHAIP